MSSPRSWWSASRPPSSSSREARFSSPRSGRQPGGNVQVHMASIVVVGSLNMDLVCQAHRMPSAGETVRGTTFSTVPGGKGANQAAAAALLGGQVTMVGCVGDDAFGDRLLRSLGDLGGAPPG